MYAFRLWTKAKYIRLGMREKSKLVGLCTLDLFYHLQTKVLYIHVSMLMLQMYNGNENKLSDVN